MNDDDVIPSLFYILHPHLGHDSGAAPESLLQAVRHDILLLHVHLAAWDLHKVAEVDAAITFMEQIMCSRLHIDPSERAPIGLRHTCLRQMSRNLDTVLAVYDAVRSCECDIVTRYLLIPIELYRIWVYLCKRRCSLFGNAMKRQISEDLLRQSGVRVSKGMTMVEKENALLSHLFSRPRKPTDYDVMSAWSRLRSSSFQGSSE